LAICAESYEALPGFDYLKSEVGSVI